MNHVSSADKTRLYVKDWGNGRPVVLLHGWLLSSDSRDERAMEYDEVPHGLFATHKARFTKDLLSFLG